MYGLSTNRRMNALDGTSAHDLSQNLVCLLFPEMKVDYREYYLGKSWFSDITVGSFIERLCVHNLINDNGEIHEGIFCETSIGSRNVNPDLMSDYIAVINEILRNNLVIQPPEPREK
jgi:hypothetical protein